MMNQPVTNGVPLYYNGPLECFQKTIKKEGIIGLYKGTQANFARMGPQYVLTFLFFEQMKELSGTFFKEA